MVPRPTGACDGPIGTLGEAANRGDQPIMLFVKTFKGYEDRIAELDTEVNGWIVAQAASIKVVGVKTCLSHEDESRARTGDLIYTLIYEASKPVAQ